MTEPERREQPVPPLKNQEKAKTIQRRGEEPLPEALHRMSGADLTTIELLESESIVGVAQRGAGKRPGGELRIAGRFPLAGSGPLKRRSWQAQPKPKGEGRLKVRSDGSVHRNPGFRPSK